MLGANALTDLAQRLASINASFGVSQMEFGAPVLVEKAAKEAETLFQAYAKGKPSKEDAKAAALAFLRGQRLDERQRDLVACVLCDPVPEQSGRRPLGHVNLPGLLSTYEREIEAEELWRPTWYGLLVSYFSFETTRATEPERNHWTALRSLLERTWPSVDLQSSGRVVPDWVKALRDDPALLSEDATARYARDYLNGNRDTIRRLAGDLGIPEGSWFWHRLVLSAVEFAANQSDRAFKDCISRLIELVKERSVFRDDAVELMLTRYFRCSDRSMHVELRDYVVRSDVWKNPKLRAAGLATSWNRVPDDVWMMVLQWVNESNLKDFFEILAARRHADEGRLAFWSKYLDQISWTRLIFSSETMSLARRNKAIGDLIAREEGAYARLYGNTELDAFMIQIGEYLIVEFSVTGNAAYVYDQRKLKFDRYKGEYDGGVEDLKYGFHGDRAVRIVHVAPWEEKAAGELKRIGIYPDSDHRALRRPATPHVAAPRPQPTPATRAPQSIGSDGSFSIPKFVPESRPTILTAEDAATGSPQLQAPARAPFTMTQLVELVQDYAGASIDDRRKAAGQGTGGRLWVNDPKSRAPLAERLRTWGFRWAGTRSAWYYPED